MRSGRAEIRLPADYYDTLEFVALANGGIGAGRDVEYDEEGNVSCLCAHGPFDRVEEDNSIWIQDDNTEHNNVLIAAGLRRSTNDSAVRDINYRIGTPSDELRRRVPWDLYKKELNLVRIPNSWEGTEKFGFEE